MMKNNYYYNIKDDLEKYPDCWLYAIWSGRNTGKTYSTLKFLYEENHRFIFLKRTIEDVKLILSGSGKVGTKISQFGADMSPFKAINRDIGSNVRAFGIYKGYLGGFWECDEKNDPILSPIGYILALSGISKIKGFDLSDCDYIVFDEFVPSPWERADRNEGKQLLDLYMTVSRDREHRGKPPLKVIMLANPTEINCPVFQELEVADDAAVMDKTCEEYKVVRGMLLHNIHMGADFQETEEKMPALAAMVGTAWHEMTVGSGFSYNDLSMIGKSNMKGFRCIDEIIYRRFRWYVYQKEGKFYVCKARGIPRDGSFDLNRDQDARRFWLEVGIDLRCEYVDGNVWFETYTMFDVIVNYKKFFPFV